MTPLRSFLPDEMSVRLHHVAASEGTLSREAQALLLVGLVAWAAELSNRIDALPLDELAGIGQQLQTHPILGRFLGVGR